MQPHRSKGYRFAYPLVTTGLCLGPIVLCAGCRSEPASSPVQPSSSFSAPEKAPQASQPSEAQPASEPPAQRSPRFTAADHIEIIHPGEFLPNSDLDGRPSRDEHGRTWWKDAENKRWVALCPRGDQWWLVPTKVLQSDVRVMDIPGGILTKSDSCERPMLFLTERLSTPRMVQSAEIAKLEVNEKPEWILHFGGEETRLAFGSEVRLPLVAHAETHSQEILEHRAEAERLGAYGRTPEDYGYPAMTKLLWAGDLNDDGYVDYYFKRGDADVGVTYELFLSGGAGAPWEVHLADVFDWGGC